MTEDEIKYRHCSTPTCDYKELRGSIQGGYVNGQFVCDKCYRESQTREWRRITGQPPQHSLGG